MENSPVSSREQVHQTNPLGEAPRFSPRSAVRGGQIEEHLPFRIKVVRNDEELGKAVFIRHAAYERHVPAVAALLEAPEAVDYDPGLVVLLAESKLDGSPLGTMRIQTNRYRKLALEQSLPLPAWLDGQSQAEATRLGVTNARIGRLAKTALFKAYFLYCQREEIDWMVITARAPLDRQYDALLFSDVIAGAGYVPMKHVGNIPHRVLCFDVDNAERNWRAAAHPLYDFVFTTHHPDIDLGDGDPMPVLSRARCEHLAVLN